MLNATDFDMTVKKIKENDEKLGTKKMKVGKGKGHVLFPSFFFFIVGGWVGLGGWGVGVGVGWFGEGEGNGKGYILQVVI